MSNKSSLIKSILNNNKIKKPTNNGIPRNNNSKLTYEVGSSTTMIINESNKILDKKPKKMTSNNDLNYKLKSEVIEKIGNSHLTNENIKKSNNNVDSTTSKNKNELVCKNNLIINNPNLVGKSIINIPNTNHEELKRSIFTSLLPIY